MGRNLNEQPNIGTQKGSIALEAKRQIATRDATLLSLIGYNNGPDQFLQLHDSAAAPATGAVPLFTSKVPGGQPFSLDVPMKFSNGIHVTNSTTAATLTLGAADMWFLARYV
jgi:hypothetical protein